jgi:hypothetical protein
MPIIFAMSLFSFDRSQPVHEPSILAHAREFQGFGVSDGAFATITIAALSNRPFTV